MEEAEKKFKEIQAAYTVLYDPQERSWYDNHREAILRGKEGTEGEGNADLVNIWEYFTDTCFNGFTKTTDNNFYKVYADLFEQIDTQEQSYTDFSEQPEEEEYISRKYFGNEESSIPKVVEWYGNWEMFSSKMSFGWLDKYRLGDAPTRKVRRLMEKENKKVRDKARKTYNQSIRALVSFVKKRDPRWQSYMEEEARKREDRKGKVLEMNKERMAKKKEKLQEIQEAYERGMEELDIDGLELDDESEEGELESLYCLICKKNFRSKNQWLNHEKSKKHLEEVEKVKSTLMFDDESLDDISILSMQEDVSPEGSTGREIEEEEESEEVVEPTQEPLEESLEVEGESEYLLEEEEELEELIPAHIARRNKKKKNKKKKINGAAAFYPDIDEEEPVHNPDHSKDAQEGIHSPGESQEAPPIEPQPKKLTAKEKRRMREQKKQAAARAAKEANPGRKTLKSAMDTSLQCAVCMNTFSSRNKLFQHMKKTKHTVPL